jgi:hypothetical protein
MANAKGAPNPITRESLVSDLRGWPNRRREPAIGGSLRGH